MKTVSVALATYNGEQYLRELLDSVLSQTVEVTEICISDDCSTDGTWQILKEYAARVPNIRLQRNERNFGYQRNFEIALSMCSGMYLMLCDQDDVWLSHKVETLLSEIGDRLLVASDGHVVGADLTRMGHRLSDTYRIRDAEWSFRTVLIGNRFSGCTMMIRRDLILLAGRLPVYLPHDWWLVLIAVDRQRFRFIPECLILYRQHDHNAIGVLEHGSITKRISRIGNTDAAIAYNSRRLLRYYEIVRRDVISVRSRQDIEELIRYHESFFCRRFRPVAALRFFLYYDHLMVTGNDRISRVGRLFKSLRGIAQPERLSEIRREAGYL